MQIAFVALIHCSMGQPEVAEGGMRTYLQDVRGRVNTPSFAPAAAWFVEALQRCSVAALQNRAAEGEKAI